MKLEEFKKSGKPEYYSTISTPYEKECAECHKKHVLYTQADEHPEYYAEVALECTCGEMVVFNLPVN